MPAYGSQKPTHPRAGREVSKLPWEDQRTAIVLHSTLFRPPFNADTCTVSLGLMWAAWLPCDQRNELAICHGMCTLTQIPQCLDLLAGHTIWQQ